MAAPGPAERSRPTLLILLAAALTLLTLQVRGAQPLDAFQQGIRDIIGPVTYKHLTLPTSDLV